MNIYIYNYIYWKFLPSSCPSHEVTPRSRRKRLATGTPKKLGIDHHRPCFGARFAMASFHGGIAQVNLMRKRWGKNMFYHGITGPELGLNPPLFGHRAPAEHCTAHIYFPPARDDQESTQVGVWK